MFKRIVFNQFHDLKRQGRNPLKARTGALMLVSVLIILAVLVIYFIGLELDYFNMPSRPQGYSGKFIGKIGGLAVLAIVFGLLYLGVGKTRIERYLQEYEQMDADTQKAESKKGLLYFLVPFFILLGTVMYIALSNV